MERVKPNNESLDAYVNSIEQGLMIVNDYRKEKGSQGNKKEVFLVARLAREPYMRLNSYNYASIETSNIEDCLVDICRDEQNPSAEVDVWKAHVVADSLDEALRMIEKEGEDTSTIRSTLRFYRTGLEGTLSEVFTPSEPTLASIVHRQANFALYDLIPREVEIQSLPKYAQKSRKKLLKAEKALNKVVEHHNSTNASKYGFIENAKNKLAGFTNYASSQFIFIKYKIFMQRELKEIRKNNIKYHSMVKASNKKQRRYLVKMSRMNSIQGFAERKLYIAKSKLAETDRINKKKMDALKIKLGYNISAVA